jgi:formylmethanofuran dehydrogenase subunit D
VFAQIVAETASLGVRHSLACDLMAENFILIPGRTSEQGCGISEGKFKDDYVRETSVLQVAPEDLERLGLKEGESVRLRSEAGQVEVAVAAAKKGELPGGVLFIAYGDISSRLMGGDTHGSGMPTSKGIDVELEKIAEPAAARSEE